MDIKERLKDLIEFVKCPETGSAHYGRWGILHREQRVYLDKLARDCLLLFEEMDKEIRTTYNRLAELEDKIERGDLVDVKENHLIAISRGSGKSSKRLETIEILTKYENGTLIELPCKVGDTVYQFDNGGEIYEMFILSITIYQNKIYYETIGVDFDNTAIGESIFLTKSEAEKKIKELEE